MRFCYLPTSKVKPDPNNPFPPLEGEEYDDFKESIRRHGIREPLKVVEESDDEYIVSSGHNRLRAAIELGINKIPCIIEDPTMFEADMETEIFRRHLMWEDRKKYKDIKEARAKEKKDKYFRGKLISDLYDKWSSGLIPEEFALVLAKQTRAEQVTSFESLKGVVEVDPDEEFQEKLKKELQQTKEQVQKLRETLQTKEASLEELRKREIKTREVVEEKFAELEKAKLNVDKVVRKEYEKEIQELHKNLKELSLQIKEKNKEIERTKEDQEKAERIIKDKQAEMNAFLLKEKDYREHFKKIIQITSPPQSVLNRLNIIISELDILSDHVTQLTWDKDTAAEVDRKAEEIIKKVQKVAKDMRENVATEIEEVQMSNKL